MENFKEEIVFQGAVNMQYQGLGSVLGHNKGGQLTLTDKRLIFKAHALNIGQKEYIVPLQDIKFAQDTFHVLTPTPNMIKVELQSGEVYQFVVKGKDKDTWKNLILEYATKARNIDAQNITPLPVNTTNGAQTVNTTNDMQTVNITNGTQAENTNQKSKKKAINGIICFLIGWLVVIFLFGGGTGKAEEIEKAEKTVISLVTSRYGEIPTVEGKVLKDIDNHVLVVVTFEVKIGNNIFDGSYLIDVSDTNQLIMRQSNEMPIDFDYEGNLEEIRALWGI
ncbi:MAG: hypothetical protein K2N89_12470 [Lachnospiraceae bacterium]|nr:hypothetical protein [Lachnospiraceae bacterium]